MKACFESVIQPDLRRLNSEILFAIVGRAAAIATGCKADIRGAGFPMYENRQNRVLGIHLMALVFPLCTYLDGSPFYFSGAEFAKTWRAKFGNCIEAYDETAFASTDFVSDRLSPG